MPVGRLTPDFQTRERERVGGGGGEFGVSSLLLLVIMIKICRRSSHLTLTSVPQVHLLGVLALRQGGRQVRHVLRPHGLGLAAGLGPDLDLDLGGGGGGDGERPERGAGGRAVPLGAGEDATDAGGPTADVRGGCGAGGGPELSAGHSALSGHGPPAAHRRGRGRGRQLRRRRDEEDELAPGRQAGSGACSSPAQSCLQTRRGRGGLPAVPHHPKDGQAGGERALEMAGRASRSSVRGLSRKGGQRRAWGGGGGEEGRAEEGRGEEGRAEEGREEGRKEEGRAEEGRREEGILDAVVPQVQRPDIPVSAS